MAICRERVCEVVLAILLPPLGVCFRHGFYSVEFWICLILTLFGYLPGIIYALYTIFFVENNFYGGDDYRQIYA